MIEELKPCPEMVEKVARALVPVTQGAQEDEFGHDLPDKQFDDLTPDWQEAYRGYARAAITAYDPDKRLREAALREAADWLRRNFAALGETNLFCATNAMLNELGVDEDIADALKLRAELGYDKAALSHNGG